MTWKGTATGAKAPSLLVIALVICAGSQLVGVHLNPGRVMVTLTF